MPGLIDVFVPTTADTGAWTRVDLTSWTYSDGTVSGLVTGTTATTITVSDQEANTTVARWARYLGPEIPASSLVQIRVQRVDAGALDRAGIALGATDDADDDPRFVGGPYETDVTQQHFGAEDGASWSVVQAGVVASYVTLQTDASGAICNGSAMAVDVSGDTLTQTEQAGTATTTTPRLVCYVRRGNVGGGVATIDYRIDYRILTAIVT